MASNQGQILDEVKARLVARNLTGITTNVVRRRVATIRKQDLPSLPGIVVAPTGRVSQEGGSNVRNDVVYPVLVLMVAAGNQGQADDDTFLTNQEAIRNEFDPRSPLMLTPCPTIKTEVDPRDTYHVPSWMNNLDVFAIVFRFTMRELPA